MTQAKRWLIYGVLAAGGSFALNALIQFALSFSSDCVRSREMGLMPGNYGCNRFWPVTNEFLQRAGYFEKGPHPLFFSQTSAYIFNLFFWAVIILGGVVLMKKLKQKENKIS